MGEIKRVFLIVLDSVGAGEAPDSAAFGDAGANTLRSAAKSPALDIPTLRRLGIGSIDGLEFLGGTDTPAAAVARLTERSAGKDTTVGHWEIAGRVSEKSLPTYPDGFPPEIMEKLSAATGRELLCNKPYSGTEVIRDYGREHIETGALIVYTSADSVMQLAAHEDAVPVEELYEYCRIARRLLTGEHAVGRVIARPFTGEHPYTRTSRRHDFSLEPEFTLLDALEEKELDVIAVGKINDIFAGKGVTEAIPTSGNADGMRRTSELAGRKFTGLCFVNLVDFDMVYGHRRDRDGYAAALTEFDRWLADFLPMMGADDVLMITADHGCDPDFRGTDHTREYVPLLVYGQHIAPVNLGTRESCADIAATVAEWFSAESDRLDGESFAGQLA